MKLFLLILLSATLAVSTKGQSSAPSNPAPNPANVAVSEWEWSLYSSRLSRRHSSSITIDDAASQKRREKSRQSSGNDAVPAGISRGDVAGNRGLPAAPDPFVIGPGALDGRPHGYMYKVMIENTGAKKIKAVGWEYVFLDPVNQSVISRHQFLSKVKIKPGEKRAINGLSVKQPTYVVRAEAADLAMLEQVVIKRVEYSDGSVWVQ